jgi:hypothetical protein
LIGIVTGVAAVAAMAWLARGAPRQVTSGPASALSVVELPGAGRPDYAALGGAYLPTTRPDPAREKLERVVPRLEARQTRLDQVVASLAETTGANLFVHWAALEAAGVDAGTPITLDLRDVPGSVLLREVLVIAGGPNVRLSYTVYDNVVRISTADELSTWGVTRIYDVRDLIEAEVADRVRRPRDPQEPPAEEKAVDALVEVIQTVVDETSWRDAGGTTGAIRHFGGRLIVTQTRENHDEILNLLAALRRTGR